MSNPVADLQQAVAEHLGSLEYFRRGPGIGVIAENRLDAQTEMKRAVMETGIGISVLTPKLSRTGGVQRSTSEAGREQWSSQRTVRLTLVIAENVLHNRGATGTQRTAFDVGWEAWGELEGWSPADFWRPFEVDELELKEAKSGVLYWQLTVTTGARFVIER